MKVKSKREDIDWKVMEERLTTNRVLKQQHEKLEEDG
jgi:hypothetical protein